MVQAMIDIPDEVNQILNIVKAKHNLRTKSDAIAKVVTEYGSDFLEPELRPEYIEKAKKISKQESIHIGTAKDFEKMLGLD